MTPGRWIAATIVGLLILAMIGSLAAHAWLGQQALQAQLQMRNDEAATLLAAALTQLDGDAHRQDRLMAQQSGDGRFRLLRLTAADGQPIVALDRPEHPGLAPWWFAGLFRVEALPGQAEVANAGRGAARVQVALRSGPTLGALWSSVQRMAAWLAVGGVLVGATAVVALRRGRGRWRPVAAQVPAHVPAHGPAQIPAVAGWPLALADGPLTPQPREIAGRMGALQPSLPSDAPLEELEMERPHVHSQTDALTGLWRRQPFVARLGLALRAESQRGAGLLLVRLRSLETVSRRLGQDGADRMLAALAQVLQSYPRRVRGALAGRLAGGDFALYLPAAGVAGETARSLAQALRAALATVDPQADLSIGAAELCVGCQAVDALAQCEGALAQAESDGCFAVALADALPSAPPLRGARDWHAHLSAALQARRMRLAEFEIRDAQGRLLQLHCPLQLQLVCGGPFEPEPRWRAMAVRCGLSARLDLAAIGLALQAIRQDARPRSVPVAAASLAAHGFVDEVQRLLRRAAADSARLRIDLAEGAMQQPRRVQDAAAAWRHAGARIGLVHPGVPLPEWPRLQDMGIDGVRVVAAPLQGVATQPEVEELARDLLGQLRGMQVHVISEAVGDAADRQALWGLGIDGVVESAAPAVA